MIKTVVKKALYTAEALSEACANLANHGIARTSPHDGGVNRWTRQAKAPALAAPGPRKWARPTSKGDALLTDLQRGVNSDRV
jgi:hypothetical protein